jgi:RND family efflux transporter MFP subunit
MANNKKELFVHTVFRVQNLLVVFALLVCAGLAGCSKPAAPAQAAGPPPQKPPEVLVTTPVAAEVTDYEDFTGRTMALATIDIRPRVTGYLDKVLFKEGAEVQEKDLLYEIDPRPYQAEVDRAQGTVTQAQARLRRLNNDLQRANGMLPNKTITREAYDLIVGDQAEADAAVGVAQATLDLAKLNLSYCQVRAPMRGRMSRTLLDAGNLVKADETILTTIVAQDPIYAYFGVDERLLKRVRSYVNQGLLKIGTDGQIPILMGLADEDGYPHQGYVNFIDNRLDSNTGTLQVRGIFQNPKHNILPNLYARVRLPLGNPYKALTIPEQALGTDQGQKFVYVVNPENKVEYHGVQIGKAQGKLRVILKGLNEGDRVIVSGLQRVRPDAVVDPKPAPVEATAGFNSDLKGTGAQPVALTNERK